MILFFSNIFHFHYFLSFLTYTYNNRIQNKGLYIHGFPSFSSSSSSVIYFPSFFLPSLLPFLSFIFSSSSLLLQIFSERDYFSSSSLSFFFFFLLQRERFSVNTFLLMIIIFLLSSFPSSSSSSFSTIFSSLSLPRFLLALSLSLFCQFIFHFLLLLHHYLFSDMLVGKGGMPQRSYVFTGIYRVRFPSRDRSRCCCTYTGRRHTWLTAACLQREIFLPPHFPSFHHSSVFHHSFSSFSSFSSSSSFQHFLLHYFPSSSYFLFAFSFLPFFIFSFFFLLHYCAEVITAAFSLFVFFSLSSSDYLLDMMIFFFIRDIEIIFFSLHYFLFFHYE